MKLVRHHQTNISYWTFGKGSPIVFLHGFMENHTMWKTIKRKFLNAHKVILIDLPCHGKTRFNGEICSIDFMAECVFAVLKKEQITRPIVFGHSMGGYVGLELLKLMPINLTLIHSNFWADDDDKKVDRNRVVEVVKTKKQFFIQEAIPHLFYTKNTQKCQKDIFQIILKANKIPNKEIIAATKGMRDRQDNSLLVTSHKINIIQGEFDPIIPLQLMQKKCLDLKTKPNLYILKNVGHMSIWEAPTALIKVLSDITLNSQVSSTDK